MAINNERNWKQKRNVPKREILKKNLSLSEQAYSVKAIFPQFSLIFSSSDKIVMTGTLQPTHLSCNYKIKIEYGLEGAPKVWVISPELKRYKFKPIPHMYEQDRLCLFYPKAKEWKRTMWISKTIIPWTSLWLKYYEIWQVTGEWLGGGIEHTEIEEEEDVQNFVD
ncbi:hypothetical protein [Lederbergia graminis]|uniref:Type II CBASS E2 protein domain-containing protein n=1 Tax=Lederbergia graminis TaxID=735518 RepID=A0ABW0LGX2_9BACI